MIPWPAVEVIVALPAVLFLLVLLIWDLLGIVRRARRNKDDPRWKRWLLG